MKHLLNLLNGMGSALNAFGTSPQYDVPRQGDQMRDFATVGGDIRRVTARVEQKSQKALMGRNGRTNNGAR